MGGSLLLFSLVLDKGLHLVYQLPRYSEDVLHVVALGHLCKRITQRKQLLHRLILSHGHMLHFRFKTQVSCCDILKLKSAVFYVMLSLYNSKTSPTKGSSNFQQSSRIPRGLQGGAGGSAKHFFLFFLLEIANLVCSCKILILNIYLIAI